MATELEVLRKEVEILTMIRDARDYHVSNNSLAYEAAKAQGPAFKPGTCVRHLECWFNSRSHESKVYRKTLLQVVKPGTWENSFKSWLYECRDLNGNKVVAMEQTPFEYLKAVNCSDSRVVAELFDLQEDL